MAQIKNVKINSKLVENFTIESKIRDHKLYVDQPLQSGGNDKGPTPLEYLFISLAGCMLTIAQIVARQKKIELKDASCSVEGDIDYDILMGKSNENRAGFMGIKVIVELDADLSKEEKEKFIQEVEARCPISDNISNKTPIEIKIK